jgi:hypothetical protein
LRKTHFPHCTFPPEKPVKYDKNNTKKPDSGRQAWTRVKKLAAGVFFIGFGIQPVSAAVTCAVFYNNGFPMVEKPTCQESAEFVINYRYNGTGITPVVECPDSYYGQGQSIPVDKFTLWVYDYNDQCKYTGSDPSDWIPLQHYFSDCINGSIKYPADTGTCVSIVDKSVIIKTMHFVIEC